MNWHHSNSRRFICKCGRKHEWGRRPDDKEHWVPNHSIHCDCGEEHIRG